MGVKLVLLSLLYVATLSLSHGILWYAGELLSFRVYYRSTTRTFICGFVNIIPGVLEKIFGITLWFGKEFLLTKHTCFSRTEYVNEYSCQPNC